MPRPKRTKVASNTAVTRVAQNPLARVASDAGTEVSDDSQGFVTTKKTRLPRGKHQSDDVDLTMSGAGPILLDEAATLVRTKRPRKTIKKRELGSAQNETLEALKKRRDEAKAAQVAQASEKIASVPTTSTPAKSSRSAQAISVQRSRGSTTRQTPKPTSTKTSVTQGIVALEESELSLPSPSLGENSFDTESPQSIRRPQSALKMRGTPGVEASSLALGNFKRRARQPSILRMVQQPSDIDTIDFDLDDFNPDDESTPINVRTVSTQEMQSGNDSDIPQTSSSRKRKRSSPEVRVSPRKPTSTPQPQDQEISEIQVVCSSPPAISSPTRPREASHPPSDPPSSLPSIIEQTQPDEPPSNIDHDIFSETLADPMSSSPPPSSAPSAPSVHPSPPKTKRGLRKPTSDTACTARLQTLLPRRRHHNDFDIANSDTEEAPLGPDGDELSRPNHRRVAALSTKTPTRANASSGKKRGRPPGTTAKRPTKGKSALTETTTTLPLKTTKRGTRVSKTYSRRLSSDKENEEGSSFALVADDDDGEDDSAEAMPHEGNTSIISDEGSKRLEAMRKKFEEVDEWEMDFESVDMGGQSSSPWR